MSIYIWPDTLPIARKDTQGQVLRMPRNRPYKGIGELPSVREDAWAEKVRLRERHERRSDLIE